MIKRKSRVQELTILCVASSGYNALYMADVLSRFDFAKDDEVMTELIDWIENMQDENGKYTPNSMYMPYKKWDFANKKEPSPCITFLCYRILKRYYG